MNTTDNDQYWKGYEYAIQFDKLPSDASECFIEGFNHSKERLSRVELYVWKREVTNDSD